MPKPLSHAQHKFFVRIHREKKVRDAERLFIAEGTRTVSELINASPNSLLALIHTEPTDFKFSSEYVRERTFIASQKQLYSLSDTEHSQGVIGIFKQPTVSYDLLLKSLGEKKASVVVALDDVQDPGNLGTIIRTAAWFDVDAVFASGGTADFFNPKVVRSTAGSLFALSLYRSAVLIDDVARLQKIGFTIYGATMTGEDYFKTPFSMKSLLVIGNEANGISDTVRHILDKEVKICGNNHNVDSLNAAVSAGILLSRICARG